MEENKKASLEKEAKQFNYSYYNLNIQKIQMPNILEDTVNLCLKRYRNLTKSFIVNILISKIAQILTSKRIELIEIDHNLIPNWFSIILAPSGFGKDKLVNYLDGKIFKFFINWFEKQNIEYKVSKEKEIKKIAEEKFPNEKQYKEKQKFINNEIENIRNFVIDIQDGTQQGLYKDAKTFNEVAFGSIFIKINEFTLYLENATTENKQFLDCLYQAYDGKIISRCIKSEQRQENIENMPVNVMLYSDYTKFESAKLNQIFKDLLHTGLGRRSQISFIQPSKLELDTNSSETIKDLDKEALELQENFNYIFGLIQHQSKYNLDDETNDTIFKNYKIYLNDLYNNSGDELLKKEIKSRELKALKLSCLYACLNHSTKFTINNTDMQQAISTVEFLSKDFKKLLNYKPKYKDCYDRIFEFFIENIDKEFSKTNLINSTSQFGFSRRKFVEDFDNIIELVKVIAIENNYQLSEQKTNPTGMKYQLVKISKDSSSFEEILVS